VGHCPVEVRVFSPTLDTPRAPPLGVSFIEGWKRSLDSQRDSETRSRQADRVVTASSAETAVEGWNDHPGSVILHELVQVPLKSDLVDVIDLSDWSDAVQHCAEHFEY
jgi:hypothetical protein